MPINRLAGWLCCPLCASNISPVPPLTLRCINGHSFDVNRRGYVNLLGAKPVSTGDSAAMLDSREAFLAAGHYAPVLRGLLDAVVGREPAGRRDTAVRVIDAGCGTGYYLQGVLEGLVTSGHQADAIGFDVSPIAVQRTVRHSHASGIVADTWSPLPLRTATADVLYAVFAPRNLPEFHRVLAPNGSLVVVVPTELHLRERRERDGEALSVPADKAERLIGEAASLFDHLETRRVQYTIDLSPAESSDLVRMGPAGHHRTEMQLQLVRGGPTTVSVDVVRMRAR